MDINKSLYMSTFLTLRNELGTVEHYPVKNTLYINLYDQMTPKIHSNEVIQVIEDIQEDIEDKTVLLTDKSKKIEDSPLPELFSDLPDISDSSDIADSSDKDVKLSPNEIKKIKVKEVEPDKQVTSQLKQIIIDPNYVANDK